MAKLEVLTGKGAGTVVDLDEGSGRIVLGNRRTATLQLKDPWISFVHAEIQFQGGSFVVSDKRSKAGTFVNGTKIGSRGQELKAGDMLRLGKTEIRFEGEGDEAEAPVAKKTKGKKAKTSAKAEAPASIGGLTPHAGPFEPVAAPTSGDAGELAAKVQRLESEAAGLRQALVARERALAEAQAKVGPDANPEAVRAAQDRARAAEAQAKQYAAALEETRSKGRIRFEELTRLNTALEARLQGQGAPAAQLERQLAGAREEVRSLQAEARRRIEALTAELAELKGEGGGGGGADPAELEAVRAQLSEAEKRAEHAETKLDAVEDQVGEAQSARRELELELEDVRAQLSNAASSASSAEEIGALEKAIAELNEDLAAARAERREALQALTEKDSALAAIRGKATTGRIDPAQISSLRSKLSDLEDKLGERERELEAALNEAEIAKSTLEALQGDKPAGAPAPAPAADTSALDAKIKELESKLAASETARASAEAAAEAAKAEAAKAQAAAASSAAAAPAPAPAAPADGGSDEATAALKSRITDLEEENAQLLRDLEEINEDMLAQEEEYQQRIEELESA